TLNILDSGFTGSTFTFARLTIYEQESNKEVFAANDFQNTGYYSIIDLRPKLEFNSWYEQIKEEDGIKGLVFYFEFVVNYQSLYHAKLTIRDSNGNIWVGDVERYLYKGLQAVRITFWSDYLFSDPGFQGSSFTLQYLVIFDKNDGDTEAYGRTDLGTTRYYDRSEFDVDSSITFGVQPGDYLELRMESLECSSSAHAFLGSSFMMNEFNTSIYQNDILRYTITRIENGDVYASIQLNGALQGEILIYNAGPDNYMSFILLSHEDIANIYERFSDYSVTEDSENFIINIDNNGTYQIVKYDKNSGFLSYLWLYNYNYEDIQIDQMEITSQIHQITSDETTTTSSIDFTFSSPAFELLFIIMVLPLASQVKRKRR
ncbi:MAG: hypothetical protein ACTSRU_09150, partial [Candidatus Hodarchaeales archaeon]